MKNPRRLKKVERLAKRIRKERPTVNRVGELLRARRKILGMSQAELAGKIGIQAVFVSEIETGKRRLPRERVESVSKALRIRGDTLKRRWFNDYWGTPRAKQKATTA